MSRRKKKSSLTFPKVDVKIDFNDIESTISGISVNNIPAFLDILNEFREKSVTKIYCLGIGDLCSNFAARFQTAFILKIAKECSIKDLFYYDPLLCENCKRIAEKLGFVCGTENVEGCYKFQNGTAFYMPHCPRFIYHNLIVNNWNSSDLENLLIVGNSFELYEEKYRMFIQTEKTAVEEIYAAGVIEEKKLDFLNNDYFDGTALMNVNTTKIHQLEDEFWKPHELMHSPSDAK